MHNDLVNLNNLKQICTKLDSVNRDIQLIAVSKTYSSEHIRAAYALGVTRFGENYPQELSEKAVDLADLAIEWHYIGNIQRNKSQLIATYASWVHSIFNQRQALALNKARARHVAPLNVLIQVNISNEASKSGIGDFEQLFGLASYIKELAHLKLRGLMGMAQNSPDLELVHAQFRCLEHYFQQLNRHGFNLDQLSMGMSNDYELALESGATMLRIGSKIFGVRQ